MQFIDNDMDDVFRKAAEDYPLHTNSGDWDKMMQKMERDDQKAGQRNNRSRSKWLLLLLPLLFVCNRFVYVNGDKSPSTEIMPQAASKRGAVQALPGGRSDGTTKHTTTSFNLWPGEKGKHGSGNESDPSIIKNRFMEKGGGEENTSSIRNKNSSIITAPDNEPAAKAEAAPETKDLQIPDVSTSSISGPDRTDKDISKDQESSSSPTAITPDTVAGLPPPIINKEAGKINKTRYARGTYIGIMGGADRSSVRSSKAKGVGYSAGLLAGYRFSKRISIETGVYRDRKKYASNGKGFSTTRFNWLPHTNLLSITGYCDMIEIPVVVRFDVIPGVAKTLFVAAGASSYIMKKEDYQYDTERYGIYYSGKKTYTRSTAHWMPVIHFSAGYEQTLGRNVKLRLEPYMKIPVAGIGVGNMSLKSSGVQAGFTKSIR